MGGLEQRDKGCFIIFFSEKPDKTRDKIVKIRRSKFF